MSLVSLRFIPGIYTEETDRGSDSRWRDGNMVRWNKGLPQKVGGWDQRDLTQYPGGDTTLADGFALVGLGRTTHDWTTLDGKRMVAVGTNAKLYLIVDDTVYDITPLRSSENVTDPFTTTSGSPVVSISDTAHGASEGDYVSFENATAVGGITLDGEYQITSITSPDTYTVTHTSNASSNDSGGGDVAISYQITAGGAAAEVAHGFGACSYGVGTFGTTRSACSTMIRPLRIWSLDNWGEDLIASYNGGPAYVWDRTNGFPTRATLIEGAPRRNRRVLVSPENRQLICLGTVDPDTDGPDPLFVQWSDAEDYETFTITAENSAGSKRIDSGSEIITGARTRSGILIWTDVGLHLMQPTGDSIVFGFREMGSGTTIAGPNAMVDVNGVIYYFGVDNIFIFDGTLRVLDCDIWSRIYNSFNKDQRDMVHCARNKDFSEIWWFYPSALSNENDRCAVYNYRDGSWWFGNIERASFHDFSSVYGKPYAIDNDGNLWVHESGVDETAVDGTETAISAFITSDDVELARSGAGMAQGGNGDTVFLLNAMVPDFKALTGTAHISFLYRKYPGATQGTKGPYNITSATGRKSVRVRGRQVAVKVAMDTVGDNFRMGTMRVDAEPDGER